MMQYFQVPQRTWKLEGCPAFPHGFIRFCLNVCSSDMFPRCSKILWFACNQHKLEKAVPLWDYCPTDKHCQNSSLCVNSYCIDWNRLSDLSLQIGDRPRRQINMCLSANYKSVWPGTFLSLWNSIRKERSFYYALRLFFSYEWMSTLCLAISFHKIIEAQRAFL